MINEVIDCIENSQAKAAEKKTQEQQEESQTLLDKRQTVLIVCSNQILLFIKVFINIS